MKVFIGLNNIASQFSDLKHGFEMNGYETLIVSDEKKPSIIIEDYCDINLNKKYRNWINYIRPREFRNDIYIRFGIIEKKTISKCIQERYIFIYLEIVLPKVVKI